MSEQNLTSDLLAFNQKANEDDYIKIVQKLNDGDYNLVLPSKNDPSKSTPSQWKTINKGDSLTLKSVFDVDGFKVLAAFSSEATMTSWSNSQLEYTTMKSDDVLEFCQSHQIHKIVIDPNQPSMFALEREPENIQQETIKEDSKVLVASPAHPIQGELLEKLIRNFKTVNAIEEAYQYIMVRNDESIFVIGLNLSKYTDESRKACFQAIQNAMDNVKLDLPLEMFFLENENWYETVKGIQDSLMYRK